jgi:hypothetical protein
VGRPERKTKCKKKKTKGNEMKVVFTTIDVSWGWIFFLKMKKNVETLANSIKQST